MASLKDRSLVSERSHDTRGRKAIDTQFMGRWLTWWPSWRWWSHGIS